MSETIQEPVEEKKMTPEEIKVMRETMTKYYKDQLPTLRLQAEHQKLIADIEQDRYRAMEMSKRQAILIMESQQADEESKNPPVQERKLQTPKV